MSAEQRCPPGHLVYLSEMLGRNACTLHMMRYPACPGINYWPCGDHFHIGHPDKTRGDECKSHTEPPTGHRVKHRP